MWFAAKITGPATGTLLLPETTVRYRTWSRTQPTGRLHSRLLAEGILESVAIDDLADDRQGSIHRFLEVEIGGIQRHHAVGCLGEVDYG